MKRTRSVITAWAGARIDCALILIILGGAALVIAGTVVFIANDYTGWELLIKRGWGLLLNATGGWWIGYAIAWLEG